ncbi:MAG: flagellar hook-basal body complex protein FliE [Deltaproteobacteria bacterium]|jgi:flagellar hook-basal body complex protein FliE|nr:MAG: flagellar hook-basal body complex protein FliE [Deltaproteobacteria bacterium]TNF31749.1 MAG: flagellar hook-basal body complex protein FliE [Deltaproteobacteria bacterium]
MAIQNVGNLQQILNNYNAKDWAKSSEIETFNELETTGIGNGLSLEEPGNRKSFSELLASSITEVNGLQQEANKAIQNLATGKSKNLHETMLAVEKAEIAFKTMNQIRSKVIDAYKEVMRMQI